MTEATKSSNLVARLRKVAGPQLDHLPTADELALLREAYAETYPVRTLLNEIERLRAIILSARRNGSIPEYPGDVPADETSARRDIGTPDPEIADPRVGDLPP